MTEQQANLLKLLNRARFLYAQQNDRRMYVYFAKLSNFYEIQYKVVKP